VRFQILPPLGLKKFAGRIVSMRGIIRFDSSGPGLDALATEFWPAGETKVVEFYSDTPVSVTVVDSQDPDLPARFDTFFDDTPMSIDLEWKPDHGNSFNPISVFQFASSHGVLIVLNSEPDGTAPLKAFLNAHRFFGKGMSYDHFKLRTMFDQVFIIEDIQESRIIPNDLPVNFVDLVNNLIGPPAAQFKDKIVSSSDWSQRPLSTKQLLYAAFDAYAIFRVYWEIRGRFGGGDVIETDIVMKRKRPKIPCRAKVKGKAFMAKQTKPKFDFRVDYVDILSFTHLLRINEEPIFVERPAYGPRISLFEYLRAYDEISVQPSGRFYCNLCRQDVEDGVGHAWMKHFDQIVAVYYPEQAPSYLDGCLRQIHIANLHAEVLEPPKVKCTFCSRVMPTFHCYYTHCRLMHTDEIDDVPVRSPKQLILEHLQSTNQVDGLACKLCGLTAENPLELEDHAWEMHGSLVSEMLKHHPVHYQDDTFRRAFHYGMMCLNEILVGQMCHGSITCSFCKIGFDDPGELFIHLFHRHTRLCAVSAKAIDVWPLKAADMLDELLGALKRVCMENALRTLVDRGIYRLDETMKRCIECKCDLKNEEDAWKHAAVCHLVVIF
jgi:hypothetical protein